jgi:protein-disulfide isomerase
MIRLHWIAMAAVAGAAALPAVPAAAAAKQAVVVKDWTQTVAQTPAGGFRMGNPAAKVKLIEYGSLTCPHCAHFAAEGTAGVRRLVKSGKLSFEFRNFVLNGPDVAATLLARCGGARTFFPIVDSMYASQRLWVGAITSLGDQDKAEIEALPVKQRIIRFAQAGALPQLAAKAGLPAAKAQQCLADDNGVAMIEKLNADGRKLGVAGTPTFFINGEKSTAITWADLEPDLRSALGTGG